MRRTIDPFAPRALGVAAELAARHAALAAARAHEYPEVASLRVASSLHEWSTSLVAPMQGVIMSKLKALVTMVVLGTSSLALASDDEPAWSDRADYLPDRRFTARAVPLSEMLKSGGRAIVRVDERRDELSAIRLQAGAGATYVYSIVVRFDDGTRQHLAVGRWLYAGAPKLKLEVASDRGGIDRILVQTWTNHAATFQVFGERRGRADLPPPPPLPRPSTGLTLATDVAPSTGFVRIPVGADRGRFHKLVFEATGGAAYIDHVHVTFANGEQKQLEVNRRLAAGELLDLALADSPRAITTITLMPDHGGAATPRSTGKLSVSIE
jgi:hypothetical protein